MNDNKPLQALYSVFLGVLLALFVGVGIATFYPAPEPPEPTPAPMVEGEKTLQEIEAENRDSERAYQDYQEEVEPYHRNVSIIALIAAVTFIVASIVFERYIKVLASGVMLGGIFTLLYSIGRGFAADDNRYVFLVLTLSVVLVMYLGYRRFVQTQTSKKKKQKR